MIQQYIDTKSLLIELILKLSDDFNTASANFSNVFSYFDEELAHLIRSQLILIKNGNNTDLDYVI